MKKTHTPHKGFVVLFTVLIAAVTLAMAVGIANISLKQIVLSASATDANKSFYAADTGIECALFHDLKTIPTVFSQFVTNFSIDCAGTSGIQVANTAGGTGGYFQSLVFPAPFPGFQVPVGPTGEYCAYVTVDKTDTTLLTRVISRGVNVPCGQDGTRVVERTIEVTY